MESKDITEVVVLCILDILILTGNAVVIYAFSYRSTRSRTFTNHFIVNLAIADLLVGILPLPFWIYVRAGFREAESTAYRVFLGFDVTFGCTSILSLALISLERMVAIRYPTRHLTLSKEPIVAAILIAWVFGILCGGLSLQFGGQPIYTYCLFVLVFCCPTIVVVLCYSLIFRIAKRSAKANDNKMRRELKTSKMISIIIGLFLLCWLPFFIMNIVYLNCFSWCESIPNEILLVSKVLHYSNSMMNVCVYAACSPVFRRSFKLILQRKLSRTHSRSGSSMRSTIRSNVTSKDSSCEVKESEAAAIANNSRTSSSNSRDSTNGVQC